MKEKMKDMIKKGKWLGNTMLTVLLIAVVVAIVIALNVFVNKQNISDIDLTKEKLYSLSEESKGKVGNVTQNTKIILWRFLNSIILSFISLSTFFFIIV